MSSWKAWLEGRGAGPPQGRERREETNADAAPPLDNVHPWGFNPLSCKTLPPQGHLL